MQAYLLEDDDERNSVTASVINAPDDGWGEVSDALMGTWRRNPNRGVRILREYLGDGSDPVRLTRVLCYLSAKAFSAGEIGNEQTDAIRKFCERKYRLMGREKTLDRS